MRSFWQLSHVDAGYDTKNIFTFQIAASRPDLNDRSSMSRFQYTFMDRLKALPGVESVGYITTLPLDEGAGSQNITTPRLVASGAEAPLVRVAGAGGAYFQTMGIALLRGRYFERVEEEQGMPHRDHQSGGRASCCFPDEDPIDKQVRPATGGPEVVHRHRRGRGRPRRRPAPRLAGADGVPAGRVRVAGIRHEVEPRGSTASRRCARSSARSFRRRRCIASSPWSAWPRTRWPACHSRC